MRSNPCIIGVKIPFDPYDTETMTEQSGILKQRKTVTEKSGIYI